MFPEARGVEFLIIAALALIVVGPKELPGLLRKLGQFVAKMRNIANDFRTSFDEMARQSELDDLRKQVEEMRTQTVAAMPADPIASDPAIDQFRQEFEASLNSTPDYGAAPAATPELAPEPAKPARKRTVTAKSTVAEMTSLPAKKAPAKKATTQTAPLKKAPPKKAAPKKPSAKSKPAAGDKAQ